MGIPHHKLRYVCFDVVNVGHEVAIVFGGGAFSLLEEDFATTFDGAEVNFASDLPQISVELDEAGDGDVVSGCLGVWNFLFNLCCPCIGVWQVKVF